MPDSKFRVIVVGGGPVGLTAACALVKAGIDFVVLEKSETIYSNRGAGLALGPGTLRVLDQLGLWDRLQPVSNILTSKSVHTHDGRRFGYRRIYDELTKLFGYKIPMVDRRDMLQTLYDSLGADAQSKVLTKKEIIAIQSTEEGVQVRCSDGTVEEGAMIIGADGVRSVVRQHMRNAALKEAHNPKVDINDEQPFETTYRVLFGSAPKTDDLVEGQVYETHGGGGSTQCHVGRERLWFFVYEPLDKPTRDAVHYSQADADEYAARWANRHLAEKVLFKDVYAKSLGSGLTNLEEGTLKKWAWKRMVLVGDAAHKVTPNTGFGYNNGVADVTELMNGLYELLQSRPSGAVDTKSLETVFAAYQAQRTAFLKLSVDSSATATRASAWQSWWLKFMDYYLSRFIYVERWVFIYLFGPHIKKLPVLNWLSEGHHMSGTMPYTYFPKLQDR